MGSTLSRCTSRGSSAISGLSGVSHRIVDRQPNWLVPPTKCRGQRNFHQPGRYRTPTPYPKEDRKPLEDDSTAQLEAAHQAPEKTPVLDQPVFHHAELAFRHHRRTSTLTQAPSPRSPRPQTASTITWDVCPRVNRFERVA